MNFSTARLASVIALCSWACGQDSFAPRRSSDVIDGIDGGFPIPAVFDSAAGIDAGPSESGTNIPVTRLRVAHLVPNLGVVDVCYRLASDQPFRGPLLAGAGLATETTANASGSGNTAAGSEGAGDGWDAAASADAAAGTDGPRGDAGSGKGTGIGFLSVSGYVTIEGSGRFELGVVAGTSGTCAQPRSVGFVTLQASKWATVALLGGLDDNRRATDVVVDTAAFLDDPTAIPEFTRTRFVHAALGSTSTASRPFAVTFRGDHNEFPMAARVEPGRPSTTSSAEPEVDALGYHASPPIADPVRIELSDGADAGRRWLSAASTLGAAAETAHTGFIVDGQPDGLAVLWCNDTGAYNLVTACQLVSTNTTH